MRRGLPHWETTAGADRLDFIQGVGGEVFPKARNDKALNNQGFVV